MARLPGDNGWLIQQIGGEVILFQEGSEEVIVQFDPSDQNATAIAQGIIANCEQLNPEQKSFGNFWSGYFYAYACMSGLDV
jgi:hypothetical protein